MKKFLHKSLSLLLALALAVSLAVPVLAAEGDSTEENPVAAEPADPEGSTGEPETPEEPTGEDPAVDEPSEEDPDEEEEATEDTLVLEETSCTARIGQYQTLTLTAPAATVKSGETDVSAQYTFSYAWVDQDNKPLSEDVSAQVTSAFQGQITALCTVTAQNNEAPDKTLSAVCSYTIDVLPGTVLGAQVEVSNEGISLDQLLDLEGKHSVLEQLTQGISEDPMIPAIPGLIFVEFLPDTITGAEAGTLNVTAETTYRLEGDPLLSAVTFTPAAPGTYEIHFLAYGDETYYGQLEIVVTEAAPDDGAIHCGSAGFTFNGSDFFHSNDADPVESIVFGAPSAGHLLRDFVKGSGIPDQGARYYTNAAVHGDYHVSTLSYLPAAGYSGQVTLPVTLTTRSGKVLEDTILIDVTSKTVSDYFTDVTETTVGSWAANAVDFAYECGLINGIGGDRFGPDASMTRAMLVTVLYRAAGSPEVTITTNFTDLNVGSYYYEAVVWANVMGIVNGITDTTFGPDNPVTRQQIAAILYRYADAMGALSQTEGNLNAFTDKDSVDSYAAVPMTWAVGRGIITGTTDTTLSPQNHATRAQVAVMLHRYLIGQ